MSTQKDGARVWVTTEIQVLSLLLYVGHNFGCQATDRKSGPTHNSFSSRLVENLKCKNKCLFLRLFSPLTEEAYQKHTHNSEVALLFVKFGTVPIRLEGEVWKTLSSNCFAHSTNGQTVLSRCSLLAVTDNWGTRY